jgi:hypothetical protein
MNDEIPFQRLTAITSLLAGVLALGSIVLLALAVGFNIDAFSNPHSMLVMSASSVSLFRWGMIFDMFGYYLLLAPLALFLWSQLKNKGMNLVALYTLCGLAYILIGAMGAVILAAAGSPLIESYSKATGQQRQILEIVFSSFINVVYVGLWNLLESSLSGIWWLGLGLLLKRELPALGIVTIALGILALLDALGWILNIKIIYTVGLAGILLLIPIWTLWFGIVLMRNLTMSIQAGKKV